MKSKVSIVSNVWIREVILEAKGEAYDGHSHTFDHQHLLAIGSIEVTQEGVDGAQVFTAPQMILIPKDVKHGFKALTENTLGYCIHPIREGYRIEDIVCPTMKLTLKDYARPDLSNACLASLINDNEDSTVIESSDVVTWKGASDDDLK